MTRVLVLAALTAALLHSAPVVTKVDPPNWWTSHSINPVRVLIHGTGFKGARAVASDAGIRVSAVKVNGAGTYLFADVRILRPGKHGIRIVTAEGSATAPFEVLTPLARTGRFQGFSADDLIYLIMPDRFADGDPSNNQPLYDPTKPRYYHGGDFQGIIDHLSYLKDLGITAIWLNPIYDNVNHLNEKELYNNQPITDYHGYGAVDFYGVEEHFGTLAKFRELVDKAHANGLKVILDMVANHTGPYHPWVQDPPTSTWFHGTEADHLKETWRTFTLIDPHATAEFRRSTLDGWFIDILPDLNQDDPETARYLIQNTLWWVGIAGLDGIRQDTLPYVPRTFWRDWMAAIKREYPRLRVVGEMFDGDAALVSFFQGGRKQFDGVDSGVDALFDFPMYYSIRNVFAGGKPIKELPAQLAHDYLYPNPNMLVTFLGLHDVSRFMSEPGANVDSMKLALTYLMTVRGIPMIYYGDELGMRGGNDPDNRRDFPLAAFTAERRTSEQNEIHDHTRKLARLRAGIIDLRRGALTQLELTDNVYAFSRGSAIVVINTSAQGESVELPGTTGEWRDMLGTVGQVRTQGGLLGLSLPPRSASILIPADRSSGRTRLQ